MNRKVRLAFMQRLTSLIRDHRFGIVACVIRKPAFKERVGTDVNPYHVALEYGLERVFLQLQQRQQVGRKTYVVFESRGKKEDAALELEFRRIMDTTTMRGMPQTLESMCVSKQTNSSGLQVADLVARPIGVQDMRPLQTNQAWEIINKKLVRSHDGKLYGYGLKVYPRESEKPPEIPEA